MFEPYGDRLRMTRGDYGIPLPIKVTHHCEDCDQQTEDTDVIQVELVPAGGESVLYLATMAQVTANGGVLVVELTQEQSARFGLGLHSWYVRLTRDGALLHTLLTSVLEVVP